MLALIVTRTAGWTALSRLPPSRWRVVVPFATMTARTVMVRWGRSQRGAHLEPGAVYVVATPIGNLEDLTLRAIRTLRQADVVASEDTRVTPPLLRHLGAQPSALLSHHEHNLRAIPKHLEHALAGRSVAVVSGGHARHLRPGRRARRRAERGVPPCPCPGACAAVAGLSVSGFRASEYVFRASCRARARRGPQLVAEAAAEARAVVLYDAPHRLLATLRDLAAAGAAERDILCARELTKRHEELHRGTVAAAAAHGAESAAERSSRVRGEFTLVLAPIGGEETARRAAEELESQQSAPPRWSPSASPRASRSRAWRRRSPPSSTSRRRCTPPPCGGREELSGESGTRPRIRFHLSSRPEPVGQSADWWPTSWRYG